MRSSNSALAAVLAVAGCSGEEPRAIAPSRPPRMSNIGRYDRVGLASWYGEEVAGRPTASGAPFDPDDLTAAHRDLPLGCIVEVTALDSGESVRVLVNDRGPGDPTRLIDLSRAAAQAIGLDRHPLARVRVRLVAGSTVPFNGAPGQRLPRRETPVARHTGESIVQVAAFASEARADALAARLGGFVESAGSVFRVRLGPFRDPADAQRARDEAARAGYGDATLVQTN